MLDLSNREAVVVFVERKMVEGFRLFKWTGAVPSNRWLALDRKSDGIPLGPLEGHWKMPPLPRVKVKNMKKFNEEFNRSIGVGPNSLVEYVLGEED